MSKIMIQLVGSLALGLLMLLQVPSIALAEKGVLNLKMGCHASVNESHTFGGRSITHLDFFCSIANTNGSGFLHNSSVYCPIISDKTEKGIHLLGHCKIVDKDKDELYWTVERGGDAGAGGRGTWGISGGTGKYQKASGQGTYDVSYLPSVAPNTFQNFSTFVGQYSLE